MITEKKLQLLAIFLLLFPFCSIAQRTFQKLVGLFPITDQLTYSLSLGLTIASALVAGTILYTIAPRLANGSDRIISGRVAHTATLAFIALLYVGFYFAYPILSSGVFGGGSDRDEALNMATIALLDGEYPYYQTTYVPGLPHELGLDGNPISPLPGELMLSIPFVLMGNGALQNFFWIYISVLLFGVTLATRQKAFVFALTLFLFPPNLLHEIFTGGDLLVNSMWLFCGMLILINQTRQAKSAHLFVALFVGVALSSRLHFLLLTPILAGLSYQLYGFRKTMILATITAAAFITVTLPFYLYDPSGFSPLHTYNMLGKYDTHIPHAGILIPMLAGVTSTALMIRLQSSGIEAWLIASSLVLCLPALLGTITHSIVVGYLDFSTLGWYGISSSIFALAGLFVSKQRTSIESTLHFNS